MATYTKEKAQDQLRQLEADHQATEREVKQKLEAAKQEAKQRLDNARRLAMR
jgi:hypothetical protein